MLSPFPNFNFKISTLCFLKDRWKGNIVWRVGTKNTGIEDDLSAIICKQPTWA